MLRRLALVLVLVGCKPAVDPEGPASSPFEEDDPAALGTAPAAPRAAVVEPAPVPRRSGEVDRAALVAELERGPGPFLTGVTIKAQFEDERFAGWRIDRFWPGDPRFAGVDLRPGDVVTSINDLPMARPDDLHEVCRKLMKADAIRVRGRRAGRPFELVFRIVDRPPTATSSP